MTISCDLGGGREYNSDVIAIDHEFTNGTTEGAERFKFTTLQDTKSNLVFVPRSGDVTSIYTAIENQELWPEGDEFVPDDDSDGDAAVPLAPNDPRLDGEPNDYPVRFLIPPGNPYSYFLGGFDLGKSTKKVKLVNCDVTDVGRANPGDTCIANDDEVVQEADGPAVCFDNWYSVGESENTVKGCFVGGNFDIPSDKCFVPFDPDDDPAPVTYHYTDIFHIQAQVIGSGSGSLLAASADDGGQSADQGQQRADTQRKSKHKKGHQHKKRGQHHGKGKHRH